MANISDASGSMYFRTKSAQDLIFLVNTLNKASRQWFYGTYLENEITPYNIGEDDGEFIFCSPFYADGRWDYENNFKSLISNIATTEGITEKEIDRLTGMYFSIKTKFIDIEDGFRNLYRADMCILHVPSQPLKNTTAETVSCDQYEWTPKSFEKLGLDASYYDFSDTAA